MEEWGFMGISVYGTLLYLVCFDDDGNGYMSCPIRSDYNITLIRAHD